MGLTYFTDEMPIRRGEHWPYEKQAKDIARGVGKYDKQPWISPVNTAPSRGRSWEPVTPRPRTLITYPEGKNRQTLIPLESDWSPFEEQRCWPVCRHTGPCRNADDEEDERDLDLDGHNDRDYVDPDAEWDWVPDDREELPDTWYDVAEVPEGFVTDFDHRKRLKDYRTDEQGRWYHKAAPPYQTWDRTTRKAGTDPSVDDADDDDAPARARRPLYEGKYALDGEPNTMPKLTWDVFPQWKWSQAPVVCAVPDCGAELPAGRRKYCSDAHATEGSNAVRKNKTARKKTRKWPVDEYGWYVQSPPPYVRRLRVHTYPDYEARIAHTVSRDYRLRAPWAGEPKAWRISQLRRDERHNGKPSISLLSMRKHCLWQHSLRGIFVSDLEIIALRPGGQVLSPT